MTIVATGLRKTFHDFVALDGVDLRVADGGLTALLGPSGSGKTTLLRILAGLELQDRDGRGRVWFHDQDVTDVPAGERRVGFVFQHYALFKTMTVFENVAFGLRVRPRSSRPAESEIGRRVRDLLELVQLGEYGGRFPHQLSGGQRQRIALARALAAEPRVLLLDEPFGALDAKVRKELRRWLREFHDRVGLTTVFVTHDQEEALELADEVVVMNRGRIEQVGTPRQVYDEPATPFVCSFLGDVNLWSTPTGTAFVRPHEIQLLPAPHVDAQRHARVEAVVFAGPRLRVRLRLESTNEAIEVDVSREFSARVDPVVGDRVGLRLRGQKVFDASPLGAR